MSFCPACQSDYPDHYKQCPQDGTSLLSGRSVGKYEITELIGSGGMGAVYRAINPDTRAEVAVKLLHAKAAANSSIRARFQREAEAVAALKTRHVVRIFDFGNDNDTMFLVMELLEGENLRDLLKRRGAMSAGRAAVILDGALRGLAAAHKNNVTHRDLKPENIFITDTDDGEVIKVLDFGIARVADTNLTDTGALIGTPAYMAPEQIASSFGEVGPVTDVYAMGVIAYEMLTGISPFLAGTEAPTVNEILGRVVEGKFEPLATLRPDLPPDVVAFVEGAMAEREDRFADAGVMRAQLGRSMRGVTDMPPESGAQSNAATAMSTQPTDLAGETGGFVAEPPRSKWWIGVAAAAVALGGVATFIALQSGGEDEPPTDPQGLVNPPAPAIDAAPEPPPPQPPAIPEETVRIPGGSFKIGSSFYKRIPEALAEREEIVAPFLLDKHEAHGEDKLPLGGMTFAQATDHCEDQGKRLPTEIEWAFAVRRGPLKGRLRSDKREPGPVGTMETDRTTDGVFDMHGNLSEWTSTVWTMGDGTRDKEKRAVRGASFNVRPDDKFNASVFARLGFAADKGDPEIGFRCARDVEQGEKQ